MIINRIYETQNLLSLLLISFLVGLRTYQHPSIEICFNFVFMLFVSLSGVYCRQFSRLLGWSLC
jgi:hypothetical protein